MCKEKHRLDMTNLNHEYDDNPNNWMYKCRSCHKIYDYSINKPNFKKLILEYRKRCENEQKHNKN